MTADARPAGHVARDLAEAHGVSVHALLRQPSLAHLRARLAAELAAAGWAPARIDGHFGWSQGDAARLLAAPIESLPKPPRPPDAVRRQRAREWEAAQQKARNLRRQDRVGRRDRDFAARQAALDAAEPKIVALPPPAAALPRCEECERVASTRFADGKPACALCAGRERAARAARCSPARYAPLFDWALPRALAPLAPAPLAPGALVGALAGAPDAAVPLALREMLAGFRVLDAGQQAAHALAYLRGARLAG